MGTRYYAGKWNDHNIVLVLGDVEKLICDDKVIAENKPGIYLSIDLVGEIPLEPEFSVCVHYESNNCSCIVGKPLETSYEKNTKSYYGLYDGHKIEANNKKMKGALLVDGVEVDKEDDGLRSFVILGSKADDNGKRIMAVLQAAGLKAKCQFYAEAENVRMYPCQRQGGELVRTSQSDDGDDFFTGLMIGMLID